ncbi:TPA: hypothetical protein NKB37_002980 [Vibrio parahaemolyticus]|nr:hypothetical protein [Vibrio parahaemolyticus]
MRISAEDYINMSLEELIDKANSSPNESEIPFISLVLTAQSSKDQAKTSRRMFIVSMASLLIALCSVITSWVETTSKMNSFEEFESRIKALELVNEELETRLSQVELLETQIKQ